MIAKVMVLLLVEVDFFTKKVDFPLYCLPEHYFARGCGPVALHSDGIEA